MRDEELALVKSHLKLSGIVRREGINLQVRNQIYKTVFDEIWVNNHLPVDLRKRFRLAAVGLIAIITILSLPVAIYSLSKVLKLTEINNKLERTLIEVRKENDRAKEALEEERKARAQAEEMKKVAEKARAMAEMQRHLAEKKCR